MQDKIISDIIERKNTDESIVRSRINSSLVIEDNIGLTEDVYKMTLTGDVSRIVKPGQFVNLALETFYLRRPISVCDWDKSGKLTLIYKVVGKGTAYMSTLSRGFILDALMGLGNGFDTSLSGDRPLVIGGGVGTPPMYGLTKQLIREGKKPFIILGFNTERDVFYTDEFKSMLREADIPEQNLYVTTADGSLGIKGFVTDAMEQTEGYTFFYACGPLKMLSAVSSSAKTEGQISMEERMGCGFGACMGCSCMTKNGNRRVCKEGPVFMSSELSL